MNKKIVLTSLDKNTLYVGGSGPNNYTTIQEAIEYLLIKRI